MRKKLAFNQSSTVIEAPGGIQKVRSLKFGDF